jgi:hypothetical protein
LRADATQPARRALRFAPIIDRRLDLGAKPEVVYFGFFGRIEFGDEGGERVAMSITVVFIDLLWRNPDGASFSPLTILHKVIYQF